MSEKYFNRAAVIGEIVETRAVLVKRYEQALLMQLPLDPDKIPSISEYAKLSGVMSGYSTAMLDLDELYNKVQRMVEEKK